VKALPYGCGLICGAFWAAAAFGAPQFGPKDMLGIVAFSDESQPVISPAGNWIAYATSDNSDEANILARHPTAFLWLVSASGGTPKKVISDHADTPVWSPDGSKLAFLRSRNGKRQAMILDPASGTPREVGNSFAEDRSTWASDGITLHWTPDGATLVVAELQDPPAVQPAPRFTVIKGTDAVVPGDVFFVDKRMWKLAAVDVANGRSRELSSSTFAFRNVAVSPDGKTVLCRAVTPETLGHFRAERNEIWLIPMDGSGAARQSFGNGRPPSWVIYSSAGRELLYPEAGALHARSVDGGADRVVASDFTKGTRQPLLSIQSNMLATLAARPGTGPKDPNMYSILRPDDDVLVVDLKSGKSQKLTPANRADEVSGLVWSGDGRSLFFKTTDSVTYRETLHRWIAGEDKAAPLFSGDETMSHFTVSKDGQRVSFISMNATHPTDGFLYDVAERQRRTITKLNPQLKDFEFVAPLTFDFRSEDGDPLQALLYKPAGASAEHPVSVVTYTYEKLSNTKNRFNPEAQMHVTHGYAYLTPDVLVKVGYTGESFVKSVVPAVNAVRAMGFTTGKFGITGGSFGGYSGLFLISHVDTFAAAVLRAPPSDFFSTWADGRDRDIWTIDNGQARANGDPWKARQSYLDNSPFFHADRVHTPLLIMHGQKDYTVPTQQGEMMFYALRYLKRPVELVLYRDGDHSIVRGSHDDYLDYYQRTLDWWEKYLK